MCTGVRRKAYLSEGLQLDPEIAELAIKRAIGKAAGQGGDHKSDQARNTLLKGQHNDTATGVLRRLKRDRPDLAERVVSGEISANAAAIQAGFRKPPKPRLKVCPHHAPLPRAGPQA